jgi:ATP-dependent helicase/nuclease subunit B
MTPLLLTGPAGSGKTFRCLAEIAARLREEIEGAPLILLAPRQATYQLERQILCAPGVEGFTRLRILSFQRLAQLVFELTGQPEPKLLDEQGRVMVLRAILGRRKGTLEIYGASANREGLAQELSLLWRELCEHNLGPAGLSEAARRVSNPRLAAKLRDLAAIFGDYEEWLAAQRLRDGDELLDLAAEAAAALPEIGGLWLDGFAQMTPQERRLLTAVLRKSANATLAFCLPSRPLKEWDSFSMWGGLARTYGQLRADLETIFGGVREESLPRRAKDGRFDAAPMLAHLEERWGGPCAFAGDCANPQARIVKCANMEAEATFVAREILKFVRGGGRFREAAVLVRSLDAAHDTIRRVFHRYGIRFFMDRREAVAHHPLAELTRGALRAIALGYRPHELFCALKSGLAGVERDHLDWFENKALERGWQGDAWKKKLPCGPKANDWEITRVEEIRKLALGPIFKLERRLGATPNGAELAAALREFWKTLEAEEQLTRWAEEAREAMHTTVWTQMEEWLKSIELAFASERLGLFEWLGIVEAGLAALSVGLIPPALDQTLVGAVDRSRNPDLKAVFLVGVNEGLFPRPGKERLLINDTERLALAEAGMNLGVTSAWDLGAEQFYGYIACTRGREQLTLTYSEADATGQPLNPSMFIGHLQRLFPQLEIEEFSEPTWLEAEAPHELNRILFEAARKRIEIPLSNWTPLRAVWERARGTLGDETERLSPATVESLYGKTLRTSVSRLEQFAMCPARFFVSSGLRAEERSLFELDRREEGSFQHEILAEFHRRVEKMGKLWRDVTPDEGRALIGKIASELKATFQEGLAEANPSNRFKAEAKTAALQEFIGVYLELLRDCEFTPRHVELAFGANGPLPVWTLEIDSERRLEFSGRVDRVDVWMDESSGQCYAAVFDYKASERELDRKMVAKGVQQQLPAYLIALEKSGGAIFPAPVRAAGAFYVNLRLKVEGKPRAEALQGTKGELKQKGVFDWTLRDKFDPQKNGSLFEYAVNGPTAKGPLRALESADFRAQLAATEEQLRGLGRRIFEGEVKVDPYLHKNKTPCGHCLYGGICRIDPWTHSFQPL